MPKKNKRTLWVLAGLFVFLLFLLSYNIGMQFKSFPENYKVEIYKTKAKQINSTHYQVDIKTKEPQAFYSYLNVKITQTAPTTLCVLNKETNYLINCRDVDMPSNQQVSIKKVKIDIPYNQTYSLYIYSTKENAIDELSQVEYIYYIETNETIPNQPPIPQENTANPLTTFLLVLSLSIVGVWLIAYVFKK